jgi:hypothetical protein
MINRLTSITLKTVLSFAGLLVAPAFAQEYQVSVTLANNTFPAPLSYTFDTTTPFQQNGNAAYTNLSVVFDSSCGSACSVVSLDYNRDASELRYLAAGDLFDFGVGCSVFLGMGSCTTDPALNITSVGTYRTSSGTITVSAVSAVPEPGSYVEFAGMGLGLAFFGFRRFSHSKKSA